MSIATIHSVKGLEFKVVFVCGLDDGFFPISRAYANPDDLEEERRLMYVAITRAKERLFLTRAKSRFLYGRRSFTIPSRFLKEIDECFEDAPKRALDMWEPRKPSPSFDSVRAEPAPFKAAGTPKATDELPQYMVGSRVLHQKFGEGVIVSMSGEGQSAMADIAFPKLGIKTFALRFAPIKLL